MSKINSITTGPRQSNMEMLRIIAMFLVMIVHADFLSLGPPTLESSIAQPLNAFSKIFFFALSIICVNVFVLISGWFGLRTSMKGFGSLAFQSLFFGFGIYFGVIITAPTHPTMSVIFKDTLTTYWFVTSYIVLYIFAPALNSYIESASLRSFRNMLIAFYAFQCIYGWIYDQVIFSGGMSPISFIGLYLLAAYLRRYGKKIYHYGFAIFAASLAINILTYYLVMHLGIKDYLGYYTNLFVIAESVGLLLWFNNINIGSRRFINFVAKSAFAVYLLHMHPLIFPYFKTIEQFLYNNYNGFIFLGLTFMFLTIVFIISVIVDQPRIWIWSLIIRKKN